jgi:hypothetical protein
MTTTPPPYADPLSADGGEVRFDPFGEIGNTGLKAYGGYVREEFLLSLLGRNAARVYREMGDNDSSVGALLFVVQQIIKKVEWQVQAAEDAPAGAEEGKLFAESLMDDMGLPWSDVVSEAASMVQYGFSVHEIVYKKRNGCTDDTTQASSKYDDGKIGVEKLSGRGQDTVIAWVFGPNGSINGVRQQPWNGPIVTIPAEKFLLFRTTAYKNNPEGRSILRNAYRSWYFLKRIQEIEAIGIERDLAGLPVITVPSKILQAASEATDPKARARAAATVQAYKNLVTNIRRDEQEGVVLPSDTYDGTSNLMYELKLLNSGGSRSFNTSTIVERYSTGIAQTALADFIMLGHGGAKGSQALGVSKMDMFMSAVQSFVDSICDVLNSHLLPRVWKLNGMDYKAMPKFTASLAQHMNLTEQAQFVAVMAQAGMPLFPDEALENFFREKAGFPPRPEGGVPNQDQMNSLMDQLGLGASAAPPAADGVAGKKLGIGDPKVKVSANMPAMNALSGGE